MTEQAFEAVVEGSGSKVFIPVPFEPAAVWGERPKYHVTGTVRGMKIRGPLQVVAGRHVVPLGPAWRRDCGIEPCELVDVVLVPEGPQRDALAPDLREALDASPGAAAFFDELAQFYRKGYLTWVDATKRKPEERARRIAAMVEHLEAGRKERPR